MHAAAFAFIQSVATDRPPGLVVELGGYQINGSIRSLFPDPYLSTDVRPGPGVDVVADGATYVPPSPPACVVCCEVLEHTAEAEAICRNAYRMLQPGGVFFVTAAGVGRAPHSAIDAPHSTIDGVAVLTDLHYANVTVDQLKAWLDDFAMVRVVVNPIACDIYAVARKGVTVVDILRRAAVLLATPLPHEWACCEYALGPYCPRCAIARAKGELTVELPYDAYDWALACASEAIAGVIGHDLTVLSQGEALVVIDTAIGNEAGP